MILLYRISDADLKYNDDIRECLIHNSSNSSITRILIFSNVKDIDKRLGVDQKSRKVLLVRTAPSHFDMVKYAKKISKKYIIFSNPFIKFINVSAVLGIGDEEVMKDDNSYYVFGKNLKIADSRTLDDILPGKKIKGSLHVEKLGYHRVPGFPIQSIDWNISRVDSSPPSIKAEISVSKEILVDKRIKDPKIDVRSRKIDVVIVSVNYNDFLILTLANNIKVFDSITVVTSSDDFLCKKICDKFGVNCVVTDRMYENDAVFNKGKAINEGIKSLKEPDFILLLDADIMVMDRIDDSILEEGVLYTSRRYMIPDYECYQGYISGSVKKDDLLDMPLQEGLGFFQLFDASMCFEYPESSDDASWSDLLFGDRFLRRKNTGNEVIHLGLESNWKGRKSKNFLENSVFLELLELNESESNIFPAANRIDVVIVSVDYNDFLEITLERNRQIFDNITVVTSTSDSRCVEICEANGVNVVVTDCMYSDGAKFNKGKAINEGLCSLSDPDVVLLMDADIIVQDLVGLSDIEEGCIYYRDRIMLRDYDSYDRFINLHIYNGNSYLFDENGLSGFEVESIGPMGYFQLFKYSSHTKYPESSTDATWSDVRFANKFKNRFMIDTPVLYLGEDGKNWDGRVTSEFKKNKNQKLSKRNNIENLTILYPPTINWNLLFQRPQQLMKSFSKIEGVTSIYWNSTGEKKQSNAIESPSSMLYIVDQFKKIDDFSFLFNGKKVLWFSHPSHHYLSQITKWDLVVFDAIDNPVDEFSEWSIDLSNAVGKSDIIFASAKVMYDDHKKTGKPVYMLPNGSDFELFEKAKNKLDRPSDFPNIEGPIIGYYGAMASWLDWEMVKKLSTRYKIVMIGGNKYYNERIDSENIYYLGHKRIDELPYYLSNFDVPIIPFKLTEMIKGCDPIKFYEYIASGKPVVVTEMEELKRFKDICYFMNYENCIEVIEKALNENNSRLRNKRIEVSKKNSWELRSEIAIDLIKKHLRDV